jgi:peptidoglycan hydrolase-like protein with peptidoglycan-binding domain
MPSGALALKVGDRGAKVISLQTFLTGKGYFDRSNITGYYGPITKASFASYVSAYPVSGCSGSVQPALSGSGASRFTRTLKLGMKGADVKNLQVFLNAQGFTVSSSGSGSKGQETSYFGPATYRALIRFQEANASSVLAPSGLTNGTGYFGPATMKKANSLITVQ